jgi:hypothetical protein
MDGGLENPWLMDFSCSHLITGVAIWFSNLTHLLSCVWLLWDLACGFSICLPCVSMITHEAFVWFDGLLDSFSCGLGWVRGHVSRVSLLVHDFVLVMLLLVLLMLVLWEPLTVLFLYHTCSFLRAYISRHVSKGDSKTLFLNQILHLTNPHDKLSIFVLYPSLVFPSIYRLTLWNSRLGHPSLFSHAGWRLWDGEHELWWSRSFAWSDWDMDGSPYLSSWPLIPCIAMWHLHLLCEHSHTLALCLLEMWNCSCARLIL